MSLAMSFGTSPTPGLLAKRTPGWLSTRVRTVSFFFETQWPQPAQLGHAALVSNAERSAGFSARTRAMASTREGEGLVEDAAAMGELDAEGPRRRPSSSASIIATLRLWRSTVHPVDRNASTIRSARSTVR